MIPKIIWQTYETPYKDLPKYIIEYSNSWIEKNPDWEYRYMSATEREQFVEEHFGKEWLKIYKSYPYNVMRIS